VPGPSSPVTIRITRPYGSEDEFIDGDSAIPAALKETLADLVAQGTAAGRKSSVGESGQAEEQRSAA